MSRQEKFLVFLEGIRLDGGSGWDILLDSELILGRRCPHRPLQVIWRASSPRMF